ncbi:Pfs domain protein [Fusarium tjaetaba]|uniref:Pfs domain protein n=1 Tax=Fusarium tjaetaba TaxID=1567544 RepID=A0A8H5VMP0_9HYPO|nr:Pfs domain protein [Fusarium tjaetaba]KAF5627813.1 Pfs domain protein [Fusarium tjaetaba]
MTKNTKSVRIASDTRSQEPILNDGVNQRRGKASLPYELYNVGWICSLPIELAASIAMLSDIHEPLPGKQHDSNTYTLGHIGPHNIIICCLPSYGTNNAAVVASNMRRTFPGIQFTMLVGIAGGAPTNVDIRLGDVVVGTRVVQYDMGKTVENGKVQRTGSLNGPPQILLTAIAKLQAQSKSRQNILALVLSEKGFYRPDPATDLLFESTYEHTNLDSTCRSCDLSMLVQRPQRDGDELKIHYGVIASGNQVIRHAITRDILAEELGMLCFEMEAAGIMNTLPCLVIRGICDYSDSHKNKHWQEYAAAVAAAYAADLLSFVHASDINTGSPIFTSDHDSNINWSLGGNARGGDAYGGNASGGNARGGDARGGDARGGAGTGGNARGGDASGGFARWVGQYGGDARGGDARGGDAWANMFEG